MRIVYMRYVRYSHSHNISIAVEIETVLGLGHIQPKGKTCRRHQNEPKTFLFKNNTYI